MRSFDTAAGLRGLDTGSLATSVLFGNLVGKTASAASKFVVPRFAELFKLNANTPFLQKGVGGLTENLIGDVAGIGLTKFGESLNLPTLDLSNFPSIDIGLPRNFGPSPIFRSVSLGSTAYAGTTQSFSLSQSLSVGISNHLGTGISQDILSGIYGGSLGSSSLSLPDLGSTIRPASGNFNPFNISPIGGGGVGSSTVGGGFGGF